MAPEVAGVEPAEPAGAGRYGWLTWPLLVLSALPLVVLVLVARRILNGDTMLFGDLPSGLPLRERAALLLNVTASEGPLLAPLAGLAALGWASRRDSGARPPSAALWCGALLAAAVALLAAAHCALVGYLVLADEANPDEIGFYGGRQTLLEMFGPRTATVLLLGALAAALSAALAASARRAATPPLRPAAEEAEPVAPEPAPVAVEPEAVDAVEADPHARFRRPS